MINQTIITMVVVISLAAHYYLYIWVKFKMDEGLVLNYMQESNSECHTIEQLVSAVAIKPKRIVLICSKSKKIRSSPSLENAWVVG